MLCLWGTCCTSTDSNSPISFLTNSRYTERYSSLPWNSLCTWDSTSWKVYTNLILLPPWPLLVYLRLWMLRNSFDCWMLRMTTQRYFNDEYSSILVYYACSAPSRVGWTIHVDDQILLVFSSREIVIFFFWKLEIVIFAMKPASTWAFKALRSSNLMSNSKSSSDRLFIFLVIFGQKRVYLIGWSARNMIIWAKKYCRSLLEAMTKANGHFSILWYRNSYPLLHW